MSICKTSNWHNVYISVIFLFAICRDFNHCLSHVTTWFDIQIVMIIFLMRSFYVGIEKNLFNSYHSKNWFNSHFLKQYVNQKVIILLFSDFLECCNMFKFLKKNMHLKNMYKSKYITILQNYNLGQSLKSVNWFGNKMELT